MKYVKYPEYDQTSGDARLGYSDGKAGADPTDARRLDDAYMGGWWKATLELRDERRAAYAKKLDAEYRNAKWAQRRKMASDVGWHILSMIGIVFCILGALDLSAFAIAQFAKRVVLYYCAP